MSSEIVKTGAAVVGESRIWPPQAAAQMRAPKWDVSSDVALLGDLRRAAVDAHADAQLDITDNRIAAIRERASEVSIPPRC